MFEKSYSGKCVWIQVLSSIWRIKDWTITLVQSELLEVIQMVRLILSSPLHNLGLIKYFTSKRCPDKWIVRRF